MAFIYINSIVRRRHEAPVENTKSKRSGNNLAGVWAHFYFSLGSGDGVKVEDWSALVVPDTDGQDERETQAQLRPGGAAYPKTRNQ